MRWFERKIRRYEHRRWTTDDNSRVAPFFWGLEHIGGSPDDPNPGAFVRQYAKSAIENSQDWYATPQGRDYRSERENEQPETSSNDTRAPEKKTSQDHI